MWLTSTSRGLGARSTAPAGSRCWKRYAATAIVSARRARPPNSRHPERLGRDFHTNGKEISQPLRHSSGWVEYAPPLTRSTFHTDSGPRLERVAAASAHVADAMPRSSCGDPSDLELQQEHT